MQFYISGTKRAEVREVACIAWNMIPSTRPQIESGLCILDWGIINLLYDIWYLCDQKKAIL